MKIQSTCPICNTVYTADAGRLKHGRQTTCSRQCSYAFRTNKLENSVKLTCGTCGVKFERPASRVKGKHGSQFCSPACNYRGRTLGKTLRVVQKPYNISETAYINWRKGAEKTRKTRIERDNYSHSDSTKATLSNATTSAIAEGRINTSSNLEKKVIPILNSMGVEYIHQFGIRDDLGRFSCVFDFFIPVHNVVIEVNGTFWHSDSRFFPDGPIHAVQKRNAIKWQRKLDIIESRGYTLIELWEKDIKELGEKYIIQSVRAVT